MTRDNISLAQSAGQRPFVATGWFTEGQGSVLIIQMLDQLGDACRRVVEAHHLPSTDRNVQVGLAYVDAGYGDHVLATLPVR